jgi:hypothetical protein
MNSEKKPSLAAVWNEDLEMDLTKSDTALGAAWHQ